MSEVQRFSKVGRTYSATTQKGGNSYHAVIDMIVQEAVNLTRQNIQTWRSGNIAASDPRYPEWHILQDLYDYLSTDAHFQSQWSIRVNAILGKKGMIRSSKTGTENKDKTKLLQKKWFYQLQGEFMMSRVRAYSVIQIPDKNLILNYNPLVSPFYSVPRRNFIPQENLILEQAGGPSAYSITDPAFDNTFICVKDESFFGLMNDIVPALIWKKNAMQAWAIFSERFGIPLVHIETNKTNTADIDKLDTMAKKLGQAGRAIVPLGSKITILDQATKGDPYKIFEAQIQLYNDEISKRVVGGTMISDNGASRSQSEVHERTLDTKVTAADMMDMEFIINDQLLPMLRRFGFPFTEDDEWVYDRSANIKPVDHWTITSGMMEKGYEMNEQWLKENFNVQIIGRKEATPPTPPAPGNEDPKKPSAHFFA